MKNIICLAVILLLKVAVGKAQSPYVTIALNLVKGQTYYNNTKAIATVEQTVNGQKTNLSTTITGHLAFKVIGVRDSLYDMELRYESLALKMVLPMGTMDYSSDRVNNADPISKIFAAFKNQPISVVMTRTGNIQSFSGVSAIFEKIINNALGIQADQKAQVKNMMEQSFGEQAFRSNFEMGTAIYPSVPVRKGAFWTIDSQLQSVRTANLHSIYELREIVDGFYFIHANSTITYLNKNDFVMTNGVPVKYNLSGNMMSDIVVDKATGWIKQSTISQTIGGNTEIKNPNSTITTIIPMVMKSNIVITGSN